MIWVNHHTVMNQIGRVDRDFLLLNVGLGITRSYLPGPWTYLVATLVDLANPTASVVLFGAIALFYVAESSIFSRRRPSSAQAGQSTRGKKKGAGNPPPSSYRLRSAGYRRNVALWPLGTDLRPDVVHGGRQVKSQQLATQAVPSAQSAWDAQGGPQAPCW
jgi:hypothetical protein